MHAVEIILGIPVGLAVAVGLVYLAIKKYAPRS
jgi:hypothetical protein